MSEEIKNTENEAVEKAEKNAQQQELCSSVKIKKNKSLKLYYTIGVVAAVIISVVICIISPWNKTEEVSQKTNDSDASNPTEVSDDGSGNINPKLANPASLDNNGPAITPPSDTYADEEVVLKIGNSKLTSTQFQFLLDSEKQGMLGNEIASENDWQTAVVDGRTAQEVAKERAYEAAVECLSNIEIAKKNGFTISQEDFDKVKESVHADSYSKYQKSDEIINLICETNIYMKYLEENFSAENPLAESDTESYFNAHKEELSNKYTKVKYIFISNKNPDTGEYLSEEETEQKYMEAANIFSTAKSGEDFDNLISTYSQDETHEKVYAKGEMSAQFEDCAKVLTPGEIGFTKSEKGYYIIKRLELDASACRELVSDDVYSQKFAEYIKNLISEYNLEPKVNEEMFAMIN